MTLNYFFPQPLQSCRKVCRWEEGLAAGFFKIELAHGDFGLLEFRAPAKSKPAS
jgi:hypothetical protein